MRYGMVAMVGAGMLAAGSWARTANEIIAIAGEPRGLAVTLGAGDGSLEAGLAATGHCRVHGLGPEPGKVQAGILAKGLYGLATAEGLRDWSRLPYQANSVNLLAAEDWDSLASSGLTLEEVSRVLAPRGLAILGRKAGAGPAAKRSAASADLVQAARAAGIADAQAGQDASGPYVLLKKALDPGMGEWPQRWVNSEATMVSPDTKVAPPTQFRWSSGPDEQPGHYQPWPGFRLVDGKAIYIQPTEGDPAYSQIYARDAFNGSLIWKQDKLITQTDGWTPFLVDGGKLFIPKTGKGPFIALSVADGSVLQTYDKAVWPEYGVGWHGYKTEPYDFDMGEISATAMNGMLYEGVGKFLHAVDANTGEVKWTFDATAKGMKFVYFIAASHEKDAVYGVVTDIAVDNLNSMNRWRRTMGGYIYAWDAKTGAVKWASERIYGALGHVAYDHNLVVGFGHAWGWQDSGAVAVLNADDGKTVWKSVYTTDVKNANVHDFSTEAYYMIYRYPKLYLGNSGDMIIMDIPTRKFNWWGYSGRQDGGNQRCSRGSATPNYLWFGYGTWIDKDMNYEYQPVRRSGCSTTGFMGYGNIYHTPTTCGCVNPQVDGGKGHVCLGVEGSRAIAPDAWRLTASGDKNWGYNGTLPNATTSIRRLAKAAALQGVGPDRSPILADWPENRPRPALPKRALAKKAILQARTGFDPAGGTISVGGYTFTSYGSRLQLEVSKDGKGLGVALMDGRPTATPVVSGDRAYLGSADGHVYAFDLASGQVLWRYLAAPYDERVMVASQLESAWPVAELSLEGGKLTVKAGRLTTLGGGLFVHTLDAATGAILEKRREFAPEGGVFADPEKAYSMFATVAPGQEPQWQGARGGSPVPARAGLHPKVAVAGGNLEVTFEPGAPVAVRLTVSDLRGKVMVAQSGPFTQGLTVPLARFAPGAYLCRVEAGDAKATRRFYVRP